MVPLVLTVSPLVSITTQLLNLLKNCPGAMSGERTTWSSISRPLLSNRRSLRLIGSAPASGVSSELTQSMLSTSPRVRVSRTSNSPTLSEINPFLAALPQPPRKLTKARDLLGPVKITDKAKRGDAVAKAKESNTRVIRLELMLVSSNHAHSECHRIAKAQFALGAKTLKAAKKDLKSVSGRLKTMTQERDRCKADHATVRLSKNRIETEKNTKCRELREAKAEIAEYKKQVAAVEKEKADLSAKLKKMEDEAGEIDVHYKKKQIDFEQHIAKE